MNKKEQKRIKRAIEDAIDYFGGSKTGLSKAIGINQSMIHHWLTFTSPVSIRSAFKIEEATDGNIRANDLVLWLPDQFK